MTARTASTQGEFELFGRDVSNEISEVNKIPEVLGFLRNGDYLSISCPDKVAAKLAEHSKMHHNAALLGFNGKKYSVTSLRDKIFRKVMDDSTICLIDASCLADYFRGRDPVALLEWETELETMAAGLGCIVIAVHDERKVNPYIAMTQPYIFDRNSGKFIRNDFALSARHCIDRIKCSNDADWLRTFRGCNSLRVVDRDR